MDTPGPAEAGALPPAPVSFPVPQGADSPDYFPSETEAIVPSNGLVSEPAPNGESVVPADEPSLTEPAMPDLAVPPDTAHPLEQRVRWLEDIVKEIRETRVTDRLAPEAAPPLTAPVVSVPPVAALTEPPPATAAPNPPTESRRRLLLLELWAEARSIQCMFFDPRYRMSWSGRVVPLLLLVAFVTTGFWLPGSSLPGIGRIWEKVVELILGFFLFRALGHEARRYRETAPDLPWSLRM